MSVMHAVFRGSMPPQASWVTSGPQFAMKAASARAKTALFESAVPELVWRFLFPAPEAQPIRDFRPLFFALCSQLRPLRGRQVRLKEMASGGAFAR